MKSILSIDGGGMKGYLPCAFLVELEKRAGKPCHEIFDLVAGTSIGGILACLISIGRPASEALKFFTEDGPNIFGHPHMLGHNGIIEPRYPAGPLESCLQQRLGHARLDNCLRQLLVPAFDLVAYEPYFFKAAPDDEAYLLWEVARATSAAQTYFPAFELDGKVLWDGGNVANNPAVCAAAEAIKCWPDEPLRILSVGCGGSVSKLGAHKLINAGVIAVGMETLGLLFDANDELPDYMLRQLMPSSYFRVQPKVVRRLSIDGVDARAMDALQSEAAACVRDFSPTIDRFLALS